MMNVGHVSSSESKPCIICGKKTGTYKSYEQCSIEVKIPLCNGKCYYQVDVKDTTAFFLTFLKKEIIKGAK